MARTEEEVRILVTARDEASKALGGVSKSMTGVAKQAAGMGTAMSTALGVFAGGAALAAVNAVASGFQAIGGALADGVDAAREAAVGLGQLDAALKSTGGTVGLTRDELAGLASDLSLASGASAFSDDAILAMENLLLTFTDIRGDIFKQATAIGLDMAQAIGAEPKAMAVQLGKALNDPIKGISALTRVGVVFTKQQKAQIKAMQEAGNVAGAQQVILDELAKEYGGSAKAAAAALGPFAQFTEQLGELQEEIGTALLPTLDEFGRMLLSPAVQGGIQAIKNGILTLVQAAIPLLQRGLEWLLANAPIAIGALSDAWASVVTVWNNRLKPALNALWNFLQTTLPPAIATLKQIWDQNIVPAWTAVVSYWNSTLRPALETLGAWLAVNLPNFVRELKRIWDETIVPAWTTVVTYWNDTLKPALQALGQWLAVTIPLAVDVLVTAFNEKIVPAYNAVVTVWEDDLRPAFDSLRQWLATNIPLAVGAFETGMENAKTAIDETTGPPGGTTGVTGLITKLGEFVTTLTGGLFPELVTLERNLREKFLKPLGEIILSIGSDVLAGSLIFAVKALGAMLGIDLLAKLKLAQPALDTLLAVVRLINAAFNDAALAIGVMQAALELISIPNALKEIARLLGFIDSSPTTGTGGGGGSVPQIGPLALAGAAPTISGVTVPSFQMVPRRPIGDVPQRGVIVAPPVVINVDARGARDPVEVERAGYRGARRALEEAARQRVGRRSVQRLRTALDRRARIR